MSNYVDRFEASLSRVVAEQSAFFDLFYELFIAANDEVREKFEGVDLERQKRVLRDSLRELLMFFVDHEISPYLEKLARTHSRAGRDIRPELYELWLETLIEAARRADPAFSDDVELSWRLVLAPGIELMKFNYGRYT
jgi:hemoglobin-like flavoprotein